MALPEGPEAAAAFLAVSSAATSAPLNPAYRDEEVEFYLSDLRAKAVVVQRGTAPTVWRVATAMRIQVIELFPVPGAPAGDFRLQAAADFGLEPALAQPEDIALILHTSGTTSRPKMVPLTHRNLIASARNIRSTLQLDSTDCCLNIMPLFHIHGLVAAVLSSIAAGSSVVCTPGFHAPLFLAWMREFQPTWYTAVPTMHQAILARAEAERETLGQSRLRFIRSSSAALAPQVARRLADVFQAPVVEAYGMTEASHQVASNPLPPGVCKLGSVGLPAGSQIAVMDTWGASRTWGSSAKLSFADLTSRPVT